MTAWREREFFTAAQSSGAAFKGQGLRLVGKTPQKDREADGRLHQNGEFWEKKKNSSDRNLARRTDGWRNIAKLFFFWVYWNLWSQFPSHVMKLQLKGACSRAERKRREANQQLLALLSNVKRPASKVPVDGWNECVANLLQQRRASVFPPQTLPAGP